MTNEEIPRTTIRYDDADVELCENLAMLNIIGGMDQLSGGTFLFDGADYSHADDNTLTMYRRNAVGFIFQAYNLMPTLTAKENLEFIGELCQDPMDSEEALKRVDLQGRKDNYPYLISPFNWTLL